MDNFLKGQLYRRYRAGVREHIAKQNVPPRMAARISASCRKTFEHAWERGNGQGLLARNTDFLIDGVAKYVEIVAEYAHKRLSTRDWLKNSSREDNLRGAASTKARQLLAEARLIEIAKERPEKARKLKRSISAYKGMITQNSKRWGFEQAEIEEKAKELLALWSHFEKVREDEFLQPNEATKTVEPPLNHGD